MVANCSYTQILLVSHSSWLQLKAGTMLAPTVRIPENEALDEA